MALHLMMPTAVIVMFLGFVSRASPIAGAIALEEQNGVRIVGLIRKLPRSLLSVSKDSSSAQKMLQDGELCFWNADKQQCIPRTVENIPDKTLLSKVLPTLCNTITNKIKCQENSDCLWHGKCQPKSLEHLDGCLEPDYLQFIEGTHCAEMFPEFESCTLQKACEWDAGLRRCTVAKATVDKILGNSESMVAKELRTLFQCNGVTRRSACTGNCTYIMAASTCSYPPFFDESRFFDALNDSAFCQFILDAKDCNESRTCADSKCKRTQQGDCFVSEETFIDRLYGTDPDQKARMTVAVEKCPKIVSQPDCNAFVG